MCNNSNDLKLNGLKAFAESYFEDYMKEKISKALYLLEDFDNHFNVLDSVLESRASQSIDDELLSYLSTDLIDLFGEHDFCTLLVELQNFLFYIDEGKYVSDISDVFPKKEVLVKKDDVFYLIGLVSGQGTLSYMTKHFSLESIENSNFYTILDYNYLLNHVKSELSSKQ